MKHLSILFGFVGFFFCETKLNFEGRTPLFQKEKKKKILEINTEIAKLFKDLFFKDQMGMADNESF